MTLKLSLLRWLITLVGLQFLCAILWVLGPLLPWLEPVSARLAAVLLALMIWAAANLLLDWQRTRRELVLTEGLTGAAQDEATAIRDRLAQALALLRKSRGKRGFLYEQPWYAIIGPPGAGKTTALLNAGLEFPLAGALGPGAVSGVGGTRLCEWWFTDHAILIDTAGRYTTQDSNAAVDRAGWQAFLALLRRTRPKQPLNGVLVAIALDDLARDTETTHAAAIRARIDELDEAFGLRLPVYVLLTKADLLSGFTEFFDDLDRAGREQVWGATLPLDGSPQGLFDPLLDRLNRRLFRRLDTEPDPERRALITGFPAQFASILPPLQTFLDRTFAPGTTRPPLLRGVYLTSGTQEGTPIDRLTGGLARAFGLDQRRAARLKPEAGRAYFLADLLREVIFPEAPLVSFRPAARQRHLWLRRAGFTACTLLALAGTAALLARRSDALATIDHARSDLSNQARLTQSLVLDPVAEADFAGLLPWLDRAAATKAHPTPDPLGFQQDDKLAAGQAAAYRNALDHALLPRLLWRAEEQVRGRLGQPDALYEAVRIYLMLGGAGPLDRASVAEWFTRDWASSLPGDALEGARQSLARHLAALMDGALPSLPLDGPLIAQARAAIGRVPLAARAYARLKTLAEARHPAAWLPGEALGPAGTRLFLRRSGTGLEQGIAGFYTATGLKAAVLPSLAPATQAAAAESWVSGEKIDPAGPQRATLEQDVIRLYAVEYAHVWDTTLADLELSPLRSLTQAAQDLFILASAHSPIRALLASAAPHLAPAAALPPDDPRRPPLAEIDDRFRPLRAVVGAGAATLSGTAGAATLSGTAGAAALSGTAGAATLSGTAGAAPIDQVLRPLADLQQQLAKQAASASKTAAPLPGEDPALALKSEALRQPQPLSRWLVDMASGGAALRTGGPRGAMIAAWNAGGGPGSFCPLVVAGHYPFTATATTDTSLEDFTRLFGPGGAIDAFFNTHLKPYVDMTVRPWKLQQVDSISAPVTQADLAQFQRAAAIRDLFFPAGAAQPLVRFDMTPGPLDPQVTGVRLELGNAILSGARDTVSRPAALSWPSRPATASARLLLAATPPAIIETTGPWAVFRLLAQARAAGTGERLALAFTANDRQARFELRANPNPFNNPILTEFRCPAVQ